MIEKGVDQSPFGQVEWLLVCDAISCVHRADAAYRLYGVSDAHRPPRFKHERRLGARAVNDAPIVKPVIHFDVDRGDFSSFPAEEREFVQVFASDLAQPFGNNEKDP